MSAGDGGNFIGTVEAREPTVSRPSRLVFPLVGIALTAAVFGVLTMIAIAAAGHPTLPLLDGWEYWGEVEKLRTAPLETLFKQHNEHRIAALRLFLMADHHWFGGTGWFLQALSLSFIVFTGIVLWRLGTLRYAPFSARSLLLLGCLLAMLSSGQQYDNLTWTFQPGFVLGFTGVIWAMAATARSATATSAVGVFWWTFVAVLAGTGATYSLASGLLVWLLLIPLALFLGLPRWRIAMFCILAVLFVGTYLTGYVSPAHHSKPTESILEGFKVVCYVLVYLGCPADELIHNAFTAFGIGTEAYRTLLNGIAGMAVLIAGGWLVLRTLCLRRTSRTNGEVVLAFTIIFLLGCSVITALGRISFGIPSAFASRYATPALLFWGSVLALDFARRRAPSSVSGARNWLLVCGVLLLFSTGQPSRIRHGVYAQAYAVEATEAITAGVFDQEAWQKVYPDVNRLFGFISRMRQEKVAPFVEPETELIGSRAPASFRIPFPLPGSTAQTQSTATQASIGQVPDAEAVEPEPAVNKNSGQEQLPPCGYIDAIRPTGSSLLPGHIVVGWAWDYAGKTRPKKIVVLDRNGYVRGIGSAHIPRGDVRALDPRVWSDLIGYKVYVPGSDRRELWAYAVFGSAPACMLGQRTAEAIFPTWPVDKVGPVLSRQVSATPAAQNPTDFANLPPWLKTVFSTRTEQNSSRSQTKSPTTPNKAAELIIGPFSTRELPRVGLPLLTGTRTDHLSVQVVSASTGEVLSSLTPPATTAWSVWRIDLPVQKDLRIRIVVRDTGSDADEHIAIGYPRRLL